MAAVLFVVLLCRLWLISGYPLGVDQGVFAWVGRVVANGGRPYLDAWDTKGPGVFAISALIEAVLPGSLGVRLFDVLLQLIAGFTLVRFPIARSRAAGWLAAAVYLAGYSGLSFHDTSQPDSWASALLVIGFVPAVRMVDDTPSHFAPRLLLTACASVGIATLFKPTYVVLGAVPLAILLAERSFDRSTPWMRSLFMMAVGFFAPVAACAAWLLSLGALAAMWDVVVRWNTTVYAVRDVIGLGELPRAAVTGLTNNVPWWSFVVAATVVIGAKLRERRAWVVIAWVVATLAEIAIQRRFWGYHWTPLLGPLAVAISYAAHGRSSAGEGPRALRIEAGICLALLMALFVSARALWHDRARLFADGSSPIVLASLAGYNNRLLGFAEVVRVVQGETRETDVVFFVGTLAIGNYETRRPAVGRHALSRPMLNGEGSAFREAYRKEFWGTWRLRPPAMVVAHSAAQCRQFSGLRWTCLEAWPELQDELKTAYAPPRTIGGFELYRRR